MAKNRSISPVIIAFGVFPLALAPLLRLYVAPRLVVAPVDVYQRTVLRADDATYLDPADFTLHRGATVTAVNTVRGDVRASDARTAVWDSFTSIEDAVSGTGLEIQSQRLVFDRRTARLTSGRGTAVNGDTGVRPSGIGLFWPVGVEKRAYQVFDAKTRRSHPMTFAGVDRIEGVKVYRFVQRIEPTVIGSGPARVPASLLGLKRPPAGFPGYDAKAGDVAVDRVHQATLTAWVDPRTGNRLDQNLRSRTVLRTKDGVDRLVVAELDLTMDAAQQKERAAQADRTARKVAMIRTVLPASGAVLGAVLLAAAFVVGRSGRRVTRPSPPEAEAAPPSATPTRP